MSDDKTANIEAVDAFEKILTRCPQFMGTETMDVHIPLVRQALATAKKLGE